jgi:hypothetical protein
MSRQATVRLCVIAVFFYACSLFLPAFTCGSNESFPGWGVLALGWMGLITGDPRWFANLGFILLTVACLRPSTSRHPIAAGITALLALASFVAPAAGCEGGSGTPNWSTGLDLGGYLWVAAVVASSWASALCPQDPEERPEFIDTHPKQDG